jgi:hypothetical protein
MSNDQAIVDLRAYTIRLRKTVEFLDVFDLLALPMPLKYPARPTGTLQARLIARSFILGALAIWAISRCVTRSATRIRIGLYLRASEHLI